jgi:hypothetical protein
MRSVNSKSVLLAIAFIGVAAIEAAAAWLLPRHDDTVTSLRSRYVGSESETQPEAQSTRETVTEAQAPRTIQTSYPITRRHIDWATRYYTTDDYFDFVSRAAPAALAGDDRAALYTSWALTKCLAPMGNYQASADPEADFNAKLTGGPHLPKWAIEKRRREFHRCVGFAKGDAFSHLPIRPQGSALPSYWMNQAYNDRDPLAVAYHADDELARGPAGDEAAAVQLDLEEAVASGDAPAIFHVGEMFLFAGIRYRANPAVGAALIVAACDLGYDCSVNNPALDFYLICASTGGCRPGFTYLDGLRQILGENRYAEARSRARQFEEALAAGDQTALNSFTTIGRSRSQDDN